MERVGPYVALGILDIHVYGSSNSLSVVNDPRVGFGEWCDGSMPRPICLKTIIPDASASVGFGVPGANLCSATPVLLVRFIVTTTERGILLECTSTGDGEFSHFYLHRSLTGRDSDFLTLPANPIQDDRPGELDFSYLDADIIPETLYYYKLEGFKPGGSSVFFGPNTGKASALRDKYQLSRNVPNPFSRWRATTIHYSVAEPEHVRIGILDAAGRLVKKIETGAWPGDNLVTWDGTDQSGARVPSGVYFYEIQAGGFSAERKMLMVD